MERGYTQHDIVSCSVGLNSKSSAAAALQGALDLIANAGGGVVEGYPHDIPEGKKMSASFLYNLTRSVYEQAGFTYQRPKGKGNCVMTITVPPH